MDGGEGMRLWSGGQAGSSLCLGFRHCGPINTTRERSSAPQAVENQAHQHNHFALIRLEATWLPGLGIPYRCFNASV